MLVVITRNNLDGVGNLIDSSVDSVVQFETEQAADNWVSRLQLLVEPGTLEFTLMSPTQPRNLPSYDDPNSEWERDDHIKMVNRILNSRVLCCSCHSDDLNINGRRWECQNCQREGYYLEIINDFESAVANNQPYRNMSLDKPAAAWNFAHPYVAVIHAPSNKGYYLNRAYGLIATVNNMVVPGSNVNAPGVLTRVIQHETALNHQCASFTTPDWAKALPEASFNSYWLY